jgi:GNAT superfamily N-acetyltransferase
MFVVPIVAVTVETRICATPADTARSLDLYNDVYVRRRVSAERAASWSLAALASIDLLVSIDGIDVGSASAVLTSSQPNHAFTVLGVLPEHRGRGAGTALYEAVSTWAAEQGLDTIEARAESDDEASLAFAKRRGFVEAWHERGFQLDLREAAPSVPPPAGIEIVQLAGRPELANALYDVALEAEPDVPSNEDWQPPTREEYVESNIGRPGSVIVVALDAGDAVGYATLTVHEGKGTHAFTAVKRAARGRGIARALKAAQIAWAKEQGLTHLSTTNEQRNAPMIRVNESLGYREVPGRVGLRGPLAATAPSR